MTDDEWGKQRDRAIAAAFQTGRPVFADSDGTMRYADGAREELPSDVGVPTTVTARAPSWWSRLKRWLRGES